jgi:putative addiction module component (TIGR02574 family)
MTPQVQKLFDEARQLSASERLALADELYESTDLEFADNDTDDGPLSPEWAAEIQRREAELDSGAVKPIPHDEAIRRMFGNPDGPLATSGNLDGVA